MVNREDVPDVADLAEGNSPTLTAALGLLALVPSVAQEASQIPALQVASGGVSTDSGISSAIAPLAEPEDLEGFTAADVAVIAAADFSALEEEGQMLEGASATESSTLEVVPVITVRAHYVPG
jgi:hypothetical protein